MNKWICGLFALAMMNASCHTGSTGITAAEDKGIKDVVSMYGGSRL